VPSPICGVCAHAKVTYYHSLNTIAAKVKIEFTLEQVKKAQRVVEV
jgi:hypothetical protein